MRRFPRHPDPNIALLAPLDITEADVPDENKKRRDGKFNIWKPAKLNDER
jgi:hypothetical protein